MDLEAHQRFRQARFFPALDGLRAVSIVAVIWHHAGGEESHGLLSRGFYGVALFFAISGFLITTLLLREQEANGRISLPRFYLRRTLRIFPLYYAVIALYTVLVLVVDRHSVAGQGFMSNLPYFLSYTSNWFVDRESGTRVIFYFAWSLATEEQFYLCWPTVLRLSRRWWGPVAVMATLVVASNLGGWAVTRGLLDTSHLPVRMLISVATPICLGCLAAYLLHRPGGFRVAWRIAGGLWSAPVAAAVMIASLTFDWVPSQVIDVAMVWLVVSVSIRPDHLLRRALANPPMKHVGTVSYGMYLMHMLAMNAVTKVVPYHGLVRFVLALALAIGLASLTYAFFEKPLLALKERLGGRERPQLKRPATDPGAPAPVPAASAAAPAGSSGPAAS
jgi:peptidoglycan/LPS O-acetylase OafA/YrhL